jgi:hypothetical protein
MMPITTKSSTSVNPRVFRRAFTGEDCGGGGDTRKGQKQDIIRIDPQTFEVKKRIPACKSPWGIVISSPGK